MGVYDTIIMIRSPHKSIGNYLGLYIKHVSTASLVRTLFFWVTVLATAWMLNIVVLDFCVFGPYRPAPPNSGTLNPKPLSSHLTPSLTPERQPSPPPPTPPPCRL